MDHPAVLLIMALSFAALTSIGLIFYSWWKIKKMERLKQQKQKEMDEARQQDFSSSPRSQDRSYPENSNTANLYAVAARI